MKAVFGIAVALVIAGFLFYWLLARSEVPRAAKVVEPQKREEVKPVPKSTKKIEK